MTCRGCGGTGLGHHLSHRQIQIARQAVRSNDRIDVHTNRRLKDRALSIFPKPTVGPLTYAGPLALVLAKAEEWATRGYDFDLPYDETWSCDWCSGTGTPTLSVHALEQAIDPHYDNEEVTT